MIQHYLLMLVANIKPTSAKCGGLTRGRPVFPSIEFKSAEFSPQI